MKCLSLPPCDMFAEPKEVYKTQKINQMVQICKTVRCSTNNRVVYLDFFYLGSNRTNLFIQCFSFLRLWLLLLKKSLVENFFLSIDYFYIQVQREGQGCVFMSRCSQTFLLITNAPIMAKLTTVRNDSVSYFANNSFRLHGYQRSFIQVIYDLSREYFKQVSFQYAIIISNQINWILIGTNIRYHFCPCKMSF